MNADSKAPRELTPRMIPLAPPKKGVLLRCPLCGDLDEFRFKPIARRAFHEHCDKVHPACSPLERVLSGVPLTDMGSGSWEHASATGPYVVVQEGSNRFVVRLPGGGVVEGTIRSLAEAQLCIAAACGTDPLLVEAARLGVRPPRPAAAKQEPGSPGSENVPG